MATYRIQHCFQGSSGTAADRFCNTLYFTTIAAMDDTATPGPTFGDNIAGYVRDFYAAGTNPLGNGLANSINQPFRTIKIYDVAAAPETPAVYAVTDSDLPFPTHTDDTSLPEECAVVLSFSAVTTGAPPARRKGRIYLGPLNVRTLEENATSGDPQHVIGDFQQSAVDAAIAFAAALDGDNATWCVYSPTDNGAYPVVQVHVDNAFDTIRKRGVTPSSSISATL